MRSSKSTELAKMDEVNIVNLHTASDSALFLFDIYENTSRENDGFCCKLENHII